MFVLDKFFALTLFGGIWLNWHFDVAFFSLRIQFFVCVLGLEQSIFLSAPRTWSPKVSNAVDNLPKQITAFRIRKVRGALGLAPGIHCVPATPRLSLSSSVEPKCSVSAG
jgi:hypothetical protein